MKNIYIKMGWVKAEIIERYKGITKAALNKKRARGLLKEGQHWRRADDGVVYYNFEHLDEYIEHGFQEA